MPTTTKFVIEGDLVTKITVENGKDYDGSTYERTKTFGTVELKPWIEQLVAARGEQFFVPQLSEGQIIARKTKGAREVVIVEYAPAIRRVIEVVDDRYSERARMIAFPYVYLVIRFRNGMVDTMYVFYRNSRAESLDAELYLPNLPNVYDRGQGYKICTGTISGLDASWSLARKIEWLARKFWDSQFNHDLIAYHWHPSIGLGGHPQSFAEWEEKSRTDPQFILKIDWRKLDKTVQQILDEGVKDGY
jgi:hypothetical protein